MAGPILKWAGDKRRLLGRITPLFPKDYRKRAFHEPMFGGGAVTFHTAPSRGTINDIVPHLARFYEAVRDNPDQLVMESKNLGYKNSEADYYRARGEFNGPRRGKKLDRIREASLLLYLNHTCFHGSFRKNSNGEFSAPFGDHLNPDFVREKQIRECSRILKNMKILNKDFEYVLSEADSGDLVYLDPPYQPISRTENITQHPRDKFGLEEQKRLRDMCMELDENGAFFVLSSSCDKLLRKMYEKISGFEVKQVPVERCINSRAEVKMLVYEMLVTNVPKKQRRQKIGRI